MQQNCSDVGPKAKDPEGSTAAKLPAEYIREARDLLKSGQRTKAYSILLKAMDLYPKNPIILSYCGWLQAVVDKKYRSGVDLCRKAFVAFIPSDPHTAAVIYPILYVNLGRAFIAAGKKKEAVENFQKGMTHDKRHFEIKKEMQLLGTRKRPVIPFLSRSNPINKYIGKMSQR